MPSTDSPARADRSPESPPPRAGLLSEDWLATILGLILLILSLAGVIPAGWIP